MKIINNTKPDVKFGMLDDGDVFEWAGEFYIKTDGGKVSSLKMGVWTLFPEIALSGPLTQF